MRKQFLSLLISALLCFKGYTQSIGNVYFNNTVTYFPGGSISIHIKPDGVFPLKTEFTLQLLDQTGVTVVNNNIGSVNEFFVPVMNGTLPVSLTTGKYTLRVVADLLGKTIATSPVSSAFSVQTITNTFNYPKINNILGPTLKVSCYAKTNYFGFIDKTLSDITPPGIFVELSEPGYTYKVNLINPQTGAITNLPIVSSGTPTFEINKGLPPTIIQLK